jgi:plastocyanin
MTRRLIAISALALGVGALVPSQPAAAGGYCRGQPITSARGTTVAMAKYCFEPRVLRIEPGDKVTWVNKDADPHTVTGAGEWGTGHKEVAFGDSVSFRFEEEGTFPYSCLLHPGMDGVVVVGDGEGSGNVSSIVPEEAPPAGPSRPEPSATETSDDELSVLGVGLAAITALVGFAAGRLTRRKLLPSVAPGTRTVP